MMAVVVGLAIVGFAITAQRAFVWFDTVRRAWPLSPLLITPLVGMSCVWTCRRWLRGAEGGGIPQVMAAADPRCPADRTSVFVSVRIALGKIALVTAGFAGGFSIGREGPSVHVGAGLLQTVGRWLPEPFRPDGRSLIIAGGAAGMAATFNTPLAGIVFAIEQLARRFDDRTNGALIAAIIWAGLVSMAILGNYTYFGRLQVGEPGVEIAPLIILAGVTCGLLGGVFNRLLLGAFGPVRVLFKHQARRPVMFAGACGLLVAILGIAAGGTSFGGGYDLERVASGTMAWYQLPARFASTVASAVSGIPGGIFGPSLAIGSGLGQLIAPLAPAQVSGAAVVALCMAAYLAAVTDAPLTSFVVVMEMVDGHAMVLSLMAAAMIARLLSRLVSEPIYATLAERMLTDVAESQALRPQMEGGAPTRGGT